MTNGRPPRLLLLSRGIAGLARPATDGAGVISLFLPERRLAYDDIVVLSKTNEPTAEQQQDASEFYRKLLDLSVADEIEQLLAEALSLIVKVARARRGYIELGKGDAAPPLFWLAHGWTEDELVAVRASISRGVIAEAIAKGRTIASASAITDPRFRDLGSVQKNRIEAVLCAPIGTESPHGVVYLQDRELPGPFSEEDRSRAELFARQLKLLADRLLLQRARREEADPTRPFRERLNLRSLVGRSKALARVLEDVSLVAHRNITVLLTGASGTGKTALARLIHANSKRAEGPFVELNCATLPEGLVESELFGAAPGAHSTATRKVEGKVSAAQGGTLFLDEIGDLSMPAQAKLLQFLESQEYFPLGSAHPIRADVRVIAATNVDLNAAVSEKRFRGDLLYRLQVMPIRMPSLSERREDIGLLMDYFCERASETHGLARLRFSPRALRAAEMAEWTGNVRELSYRVQRAALRASTRGVEAIEWEHLLDDAPPHSPGETSALTLQEATRQFQGKYVREAIESVEWNLSEAAQRLDITRAHIYNLIRIHGLERPRR